MSASAQINSQRERNRNDSLKSAVPITRRAEFQELARGYLNDSSTIVARSASLRRLSDDTLLSGLETAHGEERSALLEALLYLNEVERRRLYMPRGYSSLFEFYRDTCRYSRATAWRRISAARCIARFPRVGGMLVAGELNLMVISMISGILTGDNADEILARVRGKSFRDAEMLVARHRPGKVIRDRVRPVFVMKPDTGAGAGGTTGASGVGASGGACSASAPGDGAAGAVDTTGGAGASVGAGGEFTPTAGISTVGTPTAGTPPRCANAPSGGDNANPSFNVETNRTAKPNSSPGTRSDTAVSSSRRVPERVVVERRYKLEFAVDPQFMRDLEKARNLLSTKCPRGIGFEKLFGIFLNEYLDRHDPERRMKQRARRGESKKKRGIEKSKNARGEKPASGDQCAACGKSRRANKSGRNKSGGNKSGTERTRYIPQAVRDEVFVRDGGRCTFMGTDGKRCDETWNLEIDHVIPYAKGGSNSPENLRLLCFKHNQLEAEKEYGENHMEKYKRRE